jgi:hypothetical protein
MSGYVLYDDAGNSVKAEKTYAVPAGAGTYTVKNAPGRVINALVTTAGTGTATTITDGASGTVLAVISGTATAGTQVSIDLPAATSIVVVNGSTAGAVTIGYN